MPTYTVDMSGGGSDDSWGQAASALAKAFTPDYDAERKDRLAVSQAAQNWSGANANDALARQRIAGASLDENKLRALTAFGEAVKGLPADEQAQLLFEHAPSMGLSGADVEGFLGSFANADLGMDFNDVERMRGTEWGDTQDGKTTLLEMEGQNAIDLERATPFESQTGIYAPEDDPRFPAGAGYTPDVVLNPGDTAILPNAQPRQDGEGGYSMIDTITAPGDPKTDTRVAKNYRAPDGSNYITIDGVTDAQTGEPLPAGGVIGSVNAESADALDTEGKRKGFQFVTRMVNAEENLRASMAAFADQGGVPDIVSYYLAAPKDSFGAQLLAGAVVGDETKAFMSSAQQFLTAILRLDSGAAVPVSEYPMYYTQFIPMPGDGAETLRRKEQARAAASEGLRAGLSADEILEETIALVGEMPISPALAEIANKSRTGATSGGGGGGRTGRWNPETGQIEYD